MAEALRMPKNELLTRLEDQETIIIDVRRNREQAEFKIPNSVQEDPDNVTAWSGKYPKDKTIVLYCS